MIWQLFKAKFSNQPREIKTLPRMLPRVALKVSLANQWDCDVCRATGWGWRRRGGEVELRDITRMPCRLRKPKEEKEEEEKKEETEHELNTAALFVCLFVCLVNQARPSRFLLWLGLCGCCFYLFVSCSFVFCFVVLLLLLFGLLQVKQQAQLGQPLLLVLLTCVAYVSKQSKVEQNGG